MEDLSIDGFITSDLTRIYVDSHVYQHNANRTRFTLAHELAHYWLHDELYQETVIDSVLGWRRFQENMPEEEYWWFEWQANALAGLILVPSDLLGTTFNQATAAALDSGLSEKVLFSEVGKPFILQRLSDTFLVSEQVVEIRLDKDSLLKLPYPPV